MPVNRENVEILKKTLRERADLYNQNYFCRPTDKSEICSSALCMAGFCLLLTLGTKAFRALVRNRALHAISYDPADWKDQNILEDEALEAGREFLGITSTNWIMSDGHIFGVPYKWPWDLAEAYGKAIDADDHTGMVEAACEALDRLNDDGTIAGYL